MLKSMKSALKAVLLKAPRPLQHAYFASSPQRAPAGFERMIEVERLRRLLSYLEVDCVFDIGANEGQYARLLRSLVGYRGRIISFEPVPSVVATLKRYSDSDPLWDVEQLAVSDQNGTSRFNIMTSSQLSSLSEPDTSDTDAFADVNVAVDQVEVRTETLESVLDRISSQVGFKRPFLKMDTQGYDLVIARAAQQCLDRFVGVQTELAVKRLYKTSESLGEAIQFYESAGFELSAFVPNNATQFPVLYEVDGLFVRKDMGHA